MPATFTGQLGTANSFPANVELGGGSGSSPLPPPVPTDPNPHLPPQSARGLDGGLAGIFTCPPYSLGTGPGQNPVIFVGLPNVEPPGQRVAASNAREPRLPAFAPDFLPGPWQKYPFVTFVPPKLDWVTAAVTPPQQPQPVAPSMQTVTPGPWNSFRSWHVEAASSVAGNPPVPPPPGVPPPPPPGSVPLGPPRTGVPNVPRAPNTTDDRVRPHIDKVASILNSLLRAGYIVQTSAGSFQVVGGGFSQPRAPLATDDASVGVVVGATFVNTLDNSVYVCVNNAVGSAVWRKMALS